MNYLAIYERLIERGKTRTITDKTECHHIVPRCMGGGNNKENLVDLTPEEHYLAHQLLAKIHPTNSALVKAALMMCVGRKSNKLYGWLRRRFSREQSKKMLANNYMMGQRWISNGEQTQKVPESQALELIASGKWIAGKRAVLAKCGHLVISRCKACENARSLSYEKIREQNRTRARDLFTEFMNSNSKSLTQWARTKNMSQPQLTQMWRKHIPEYRDQVRQGQSFKS